MLARNGNNHGGWWLLASDGRSHGSNGGWVAMETTMMAVCIAGQQPPTTTVVSIAGQQPSNSLAVGPQPPTRPLSPCLARNNPPPLFFSLRNPRVVPRRSFPYECDMAAGAFSDEFVLRSTEPTQKKKQEEEKMNNLASPAPEPTPREAIGRSGSAPSL